MVITGAADALPARGVTVRQLVYVDAMVPLPGEGWGDGHPPEIVAARRAGSGVPLRELATPIHGAPRGGPGAAGASCSPRLIGESE
jgi:hypothetical protein